MEFENQYGLYENACAGATVWMVTNYYGRGGEWTVEDIQNDIVGGDYPVNFLLLSNYLEEAYALDTEIVVTYEPIISMLEEAGLFVDHIKIVEDIPHDTPVIWIYLTVPHWVVRYDGLNFDPARGVYKFEDTEDIYKPELGLGIVVTKEK